ncbi:MAG: hypothetical protein V8Q32_04630 [Anaerotignum faecicola]
MEQPVGGIQSSGFLVSFVAVAILPAVFEERFSRGILLSGYHFLGNIRHSLPAHCFLVCCI